MRQETGELNSSFDLCAQQTMETVKSRRLLANLNNSEVYALGVDSAGASKSDWVCLHDFWAQYFSQAGANLREYSVLRTVTFSSR